MVPAAYTVICPGGLVVYCCDSDCLERVISKRRELATERPRPQRPA